MRTWTCSDCCRLFDDRKRYAEHISKHGRIVPDPHVRVTVTADEDQEEAVTSG